ncbi:MAG: hypothetical protein LBM93_14145 [Oscillospiraceae bacterium]|jgi:hypothetical protein|nr:hypothetical protein [Oscillospiraceae bacterium]
MGALFTPTAVNDNQMNPSVWGYYDNGNEQGKQYQYWSYNENGDIAHSTMHPHEESIYISHPADTGAGFEISNDENTLFVDVTDLSEEAIEQTVEELEFEL